MGLGVSSRTRVKNPSKECCFSASTGKSVWMCCEVSVAKFLSEPCEYKGNPKIHMLSGAGALHTCFRPGCVGMYWIDLDIFGCVGIA